MGAMMGAMNAAMSDKPIWKGALLGAASAAATYGIGSIFNGVGILDMNYWELVHMAYLVVSKRLENGEYIYNIGRIHGI